MKSSIDLDIHHSKVFSSGYIYRLENYSCEIQVPSDSNDKLGISRKKYIILSQASEFMSYLR